MTNKEIRELIQTIRNQKVMLDFDIAKLTGYETKNFNRQVKNHLNLFTEQEMFRLSQDELEVILKCKNFTSSWGRFKKASICFFIKRN